MARYHLHPHPTTPPTAVRAVTAVLQVNERQLEIDWRIIGTEALVVPGWVRRSRADGLWRTTCFELFAGGIDRADYIELNLAPSRQWQHYHFDDYRTGQRTALQRAEPEVVRAIDDDSFGLLASIPHDLLPAGELALGLSAVVEEADGIFSYWALAHGGACPDFHDRRCFVATLPPPR